MSIKAPYEVKVPIRFRNADPAGIIFFGEVYPIAHDVFEQFVVDLGIPWKEYFQNSEWGGPIRHSSCEYLAPLRPGDEVTIRVGLERIGESSFTSKYTFVREGKTHCEVTLVHAFFNIKTRTKVPLPSGLRGSLETYQRKCASAQ